MLLAALIAVRERDRAIDLDGVEAAPGLAHQAGDGDLQAEVVRLVLEPLLEVLELSTHEGVSDTCALNVIAGEFVGSAHLDETVLMQVSNVSPSDGANELLW